MHVAYIVSMKSGLTAWNFREIDILTNNGVEISIYTTKWEIGPHMPKSEWRVRRPNKVKTLLIQPQAFLRNPARYVRLLLLAIRMHTVVEFLIAQDYALEMREQGIQHIHCHFGDRKLFIGYYCHKILGLPISVTVHAYEILMNPNPAMFKLAASECNTIVVQSEFNKNEVIRQFGIPEDKFRIIRAHGDMSDERRDKSIKLFIAAEFREKKGHEILFKALRKLNRDDLTLWIAGKGKLDLAKMGEEIGVSHQMVFLGSLGKDLMNIMFESCDIFVLPSRTASNGDREGIPATIMEAMSHRKPVISTRHAGIPELVPDMPIIGSLSLNAWRTGYRRLPMVVFRSRLTRGWTQSSSVTVMMKKACPCDMPAEPDARKTRR